VWIEENVLIYGNISVRKIIPSCTEIRTEFLQYRTFLGAKTMKVGNYTFSCRFESAALLPAFKGSTLHGGFGHALKQTTCALRRQECVTCLLATNCAYAFLFETKAADILQRPHPYILVPPDDVRRSWKKDELFAFTIALFGRANDYLPHLVYAVREMGKAGLGKKAESEGRFRLETIREKETVIYEGTALRTPTNLLELTVGTAPETPVPEISLTCLTPLRLKYDNQLQDGLPFHLLIRAALRRISSLEAAYGQGEPPLNYKGIAARATNVRIIVADCRWTDFERYSNRQKTAMHFGGMLGRMVYQGEDLSEFLPLLRYCEITHLGKQTSFGLGRIRIEVAI
jgi:hypothetical protein